MRAAAFVVELHLRVARETDHGRLENRLARKQLRQVGANDLFEQHELESLCRRDLHESRERRGHLDDRQTPRGVALRGVEQQRQVEAERREERKRPRDVDGERRQHRQHRVPEERAERRLARAVELLPGQDADAVGRPGPAAARRGSRRTAPRPCACVRSLTAASCSAGVSPARSGASRHPRPPACRPATRTMKNSSRLEAAIATNLTRSRSGVAGFLASSSTRSLNASHDSSRLKKSPAGAACVVMSAVPPGAP